MFARLGVPIESVVNMTKTFSAWALKYPYRNGTAPIGEIFVPAAFFDGPGANGAIALFHSRAEARIAGKKKASPVHVLVEIKEIPA